MIELKIKDFERWRTGFSIFGTDLDDGYFVMWRRFNFRMLKNGKMEKCRFGKTSEYENTLNIRKQVCKSKPPKK